MSLTSLINLANKLRIGTSHVPLCGVGRYGVHVY